jgi:hypothetical protein
MDTKEHIQAANALIEWFNSQEVSERDAAAIMSKVLAKILVGALQGSHTATERQSLDHLVDRIMLQLVHDINDRIFATRR